MTLEKTQYIDVVGKLFFTKVFQPDEFRGAVRWTLEFAPENDEEWAKIDEVGIQKKKKDPTDRIPFKHINLQRPTTKLIKGRTVYFTPPIIRDKDGNNVVWYVDENNKTIRSYEDENNRPMKVGEYPLIGNDTVGQVTICVYPTAMGTGCRLESIKVLDLVEYEPEPVQEEDRQEQLENKKPW